MDRVLSRRLTADLCGPQRASAIWPVPCAASVGQRVPGIPRATNIHESINAQLAGCSLQCLRAVAARDCGVRSIPALKQRMINDLPMLTQQCEEDYIHDLVQHRKCS